MNRNKTLVTVIAVCGLILLAAVALGFLGISTYHYDNAEKYTAGETVITEAVRNLDVDWISGKVTVATHHENTVTLRETSGRSIGEDLQLRWWLDGDTLRVKFAKSGYRHGGFFGLLSGQDKELILTVPAGLELNAVNIDTSSAAQDLNGLTVATLDLSAASGSVTVQADRIGKVDADTASGDVRIVVATADEIGVNTASGAVRIEAGQVGTLETGSASGAVHAEIGELNTGKIHTASGSVTVSAGQLNALDVDTASGRVTAALPAVPGFTANVQTASGAVNSSIDLRKSGDDYICGDGSAKVQIRTASGSVQLDPAQ